MELVPRFLVAIHHRDDYDAGALEGPEVRADIDALNQEMVDKGVRVFVGGLHRAHLAKSLRASEGGVEVSDGAYLPTDEHVGGFWVLECADMDEALEWGQKAVAACRAPVEVRQFH